MLGTRDRLLLKARTLVAVFAGVPAGGWVSSVALVLALLVACATHERAGSSTESREPDPSGSPRVRRSGGEIKSLSADDQILLYDQVGNLTEVVHGNGAPVAAAGLYAYGTPRFDTGLTEARRFANTPRDLAVGVDLMGARAYVPELGVWASPDPTLLDDPRAYLRSHPSHSAYAYANSNPIAMRDPDGEFAFLAAAAVFVGVTFTATALEQPQTRAELAADMAKLSAQAYASMTGVRALATAATAGIGAAYQFAANAITGVAVGEVTGAVKDKVVEAATEVNPTLGAVVDVGLEVAPAVLGRGVEKKVTAAPKTTSLGSEKEWQAQYSALDRVGSLPKPPRGKGTVPESQRDSRRFWTPPERAAKRDAQGGGCATGCGTKIDASNSRGHHKVRHADGGRTDDANHAEVCIDCHLKLHSP